MAGAGDAAGGDRGITGRAAAVALTQIGFWRDLCAFRSVAKEVVWHEEFPILTRYTYLLQGLEPVVQSFDSATICASHRRGNPDAVCDLGGEKFVKPFWISWSQDD